MPACFKSLASLVDFICCFIWPRTLILLIWRRTTSDLAAYLLANVHIYPNMETNLTNTLTSHQLRVSHIPDLAGSFAKCWTKRHLAFVGNSYHLLCSLRVCNIWWNFWKWIPNLWWKQLFINCCILCGLCNLWCNFRKLIPNLLCKSDVVDLNISHME